LQKSQGWATRLHRRNFKGAASKSQLQNRNFKVATSKSQLQKRNIKGATSKEQLQKRDFKGEENRSSAKASGLTRDFLAPTAATFLQEAVNRVYNALNLLQVPSYF
jgi:hypothetical protein